MLIMLQMATTIALNANTTSVSEKEHITKKPYMITCLKVFKNFTEVNF